MPMLLNITWTEEGNFQTTSVPCPNEAGVLDDSTGATLVCEINKITGWVRIEFNEHPGAAPAEIDHCRSMKFDGKDVIDWNEEWFEVQSFALRQLCDVLYAN